MPRYSAVSLLLVALTSQAAPLAEVTDADRSLQEYFRNETAGLADACLSDVKSLDDWKAQREVLRRQLWEMLSLEPDAPRTDLKAAITGKVEHDDFVVEKLHFQSLPGLYVTANLYVPKRVEKPAPTILYVCGHGPVITNGISYGNKVTYQHHGAWFARNGYVCLLIDTLQLGEIQGLHHGTHREKLWWWNSRGYTPAGVEAWNSIRSLDYLETRREVDKNRFGVTGRSGGGAYSWWIAALDDRIRAAAPVAGITDLQNHVVDGVVEGHCDCMFIVNTYRWDYPAVAALVAPRPLLIVNTDSDYIFPLDGVSRVHQKVRDIYKLYSASTNLGLVIGPGPHKDTQDIQVPVFRWFNRYLKNEDVPIEMAATKFFTPQQLRVFDALPGDAINTNIHDSFVRAAEAGVRGPESRSSWESQREQWMAALKEKVFRGWPETVPSLDLQKRSSLSSDGTRFETYEFTSEADMRLQLNLTPAEAGAKGFELHVVGEEGDVETIRGGGKRVAVFAPRGMGPSIWSGDARKQTQIRRRFMLLGQTLDGMRVWDICRAIEALHGIDPSGEARIDVKASGDMAVNALYAALFSQAVATLELSNLPRSHHEGPDYLNVLRVLDIPQAVAMAAERCEVRIRERGADDAWQYPKSVARALEWPGSRLTIIQ